MEIRATERTRLSARNLAGGWGSLVLVAALACIPAAVVSAGGGGGPSCIKTNLGATACGIAGANPVGSCGDQISLNGSCPSISFAYSGLTGPPNDFMVTCMYQPRTSNPTGGGCTNNGPAVTFIASCQTAGGTSCGGGGGGKK